MIKLAFSLPDKKIRFGVDDLLLTREFNEETLQSPPLPNTLNIQQSQPKALSPWLVLGH
jgi:hypothetical protein